MTVSTHVLDATAGRPAAHVAVSLWYLDPLGGPDGEWVAVDAGETGADGRHRFGAPTGAGVYRLTFGTGRYFAGLGVSTFYPQVTVTFEVSDSDGHYHVPLLLSPFGYSTYRGA
jgi:5-hydroxyisourate hydrolase